MSELLLDNPRVIPGRSRVLGWRWCSGCAEVDGRREPCVVGTGRVTRGAARRGRQGAPGPVTGAPRGPAATAGNRDIGHGCTRCFWHNNSSRNLRCVCDWHIKWFLSSFNSSSYCCWSRKMKLAAFWENVKQWLYLNNSDQHRPFLLSVFMCEDTSKSNPLWNYRV